MTWHLDRTCTLCGSQTLWCADAEAPIYYLHKPSANPCTDGCRLEHMTEDKYRLWDGKRISKRL